MDKNMSQTKNNFTSSRELAHQKSDKILSDTHLDEDSGLGVSGYSHEYPLDKNSAKSKGPQETSKQKKQGTDQDNLDSGFESGFQSEPLIDPKEMIQIPLDEFNQMCVTDFQPQYPKEQLPNLAIIQEIFRQDEDGDTQLHIALSSAPPTLTRKIIECAPYPALLDIENVYGQSPIHLAVLMGQPSIVRLLLICGAKATVRDYEGNTPLHLACRNNELQSVAAILSPITSAELKSCTFSNQSYQSPKYQRIPIDLEQRNYFGEHCIHIAVQNNNVDILKHLLNAGADINAREGRSGYSPLHLAVENQNEEMVKYLLKHGAGKLNVETLSYGQITAYQLANEFGLMKIMKQLADFGCEQLLYPESEYEDSTDGSDMDSDN